ncbi:hypothetical protein, partial [Dankookia rubra]|uniref:hypothetical protein n=1 Tax=Dankookia rubra TaxID=1442381 RepID=UPI0019D56632
MKTTSKWCFAPHHQAAALPHRAVLLAATPQTGKIIQAVVERTIAWINRSRGLASPNTVDLEAFWSGSWASTEHLPQAGDPVIEGARLEA